MADKAEAKASGVSSGVEALVQRLREEGVESGRVEAQRILAEADSRARALMKQAEVEAAQIRDKARTEAEQLKTSSEEALRVAGRDALLAMRATIQERFVGDVRRLVSKELKSEEFLQRLILELTGRVREDIQDAGPTEIVLPRNVVGLEELRADTHELQQGKLTQFVLSITADMLREGVTFVEAEDGQVGLRARLLDHDLTVDLTDDAVATILMQHLQPRFRALLDGIVR